MQKALGVRGLIIYLLFTFAQTASASDFQSARSAALGGAGHASPLNTDSIFMNPAMPSFLPAQLISGSYVPFAAPGKGDPQGHEYSLSALDGTNTLFQAGAAYTWTPSGSFVHVVGSHKIEKTLSFGVGSKYAFRNSQRDKIADASLALLWGPLTWLNLSLGVDNLVNSQSARNQWGFRREFLLGVKVKLRNILFLYFDPHYVPTLNQINDSKTWGYEAGAELLLFKDFYARAGRGLRSRQPTIETYGTNYAVGLGWTGPRLSMDFALTRTVAPQVVKAFLYSLTLSF